MRGGGAKRGGMRAERLKSGGRWLLGQIKNKNFWMQIEKVATNIADGARFMAEKTNAPKSARDNAGKIEEEGRDGGGKQRQGRDG